MKDFVKKYKDEEVTLNTVKRFKEDLNTFLKGFLEGEVTALEVSCLTSDWMIGEEVFADKQIELCPELEVFNGLLSITHPDLNRLGQELLVERYVRILEGGSVRATPHFSSCT